MFLDKKMYYTHQFMFWSFGRSDSWEKLRFISCAENCSMTKLSGNHSIQQDQIFRHLTERDLICS